ncbi:hypothetical protein VPH35_016479 [Triticum aestivum]
MVSPSSNRTSRNKRGAWAFLAVLLLLLVLLRCSPCQARKLPVADQGQGGKVMHFEGGLVLKLSPSPHGGNDDGGEVAAAAPRGFSRAARSMRSVPSPGVGH